jgi:hypothetical protein
MKTLHFKARATSAILTIAIMCFAGPEAWAQDLKKKIQLKKKFQFEEVDFEDMIRRYFSKESSHPVEGVYSVSCVITKKNKMFLSSRERTKVVERKDNYARVAIIKDVAGSKRDFIEISLSYRDAKKYPIIGDMNALSEGQGYIYQHIEPDGTIIPFSMISESQELLEGEFSKMKKRKTVTYRLSYIKIFPKRNAAIAVSEN